MSSNAKATGRTRLRWVSAILPVSDPTREPGVNPDEIGTDRVSRPTRPRIISPSQEDTGVVMSHRESTRFSTVWPVLRLSEIERHRLIAHDVESGLYAALRSGIAYGLVTTVTKSIRLSAGNAASL